MGVRFRLSNREMRNVGTKRKTEGNRKQARKLERQAKKSRKDDFFRKPKSVGGEEFKSKNQKKNEEPEVESEEEINQNRNTIEAEIKIQNREKTKFKKKMSKKINLEKKLSKKELEAGIEEDDIIIKRLERKLGIKKKGKYEDEDILALGQDLDNNDGIEWGTLEGKSEDEPNIESFDMEDNHISDEEEIENKNISDVEEDTNS